MKVALDNFITMPVQPKAIILEICASLDQLATNYTRRLSNRSRKASSTSVPLRRAFLKVGKEFSPFATTEAMVEELRKQPLKGYHILIKGSHSMGLEKLADIL